MKTLEIFGLQVTVYKDGRLFIEPRLVPNNGTLVMRDGKFLSPSANGKYGYMQVKLNNSGRTKSLYVHRVVWLALVGPIPDGYEIDHIDDNPKNNSLDNLQLLSRRDNMRKSLAKANRDSLGRILPKSI